MCFAALCQRAYGLDDGCSKMTLERENIEISAKIAHPTKQGSCDLELKIVNRSLIQYGILETNSNAFLDLSLVSRRDGKICARTEAGIKLFKAQNFGKTDFKMLDPGQSVTLTLATENIFEVHPDYWEISFTIKLVPVHSNPKEQGGAKNFHFRQLEFDVTS